MRKTNTVLSHLTLESKKKIKLKVKFIETESRTIGTRDWGSVFGRDMEMVVKGCKLSVIRCVHVC